MTSPSTWQRSTTAEAISRPSLDGLQRTDVMVQVQKVLYALERQEVISEKFAVDELEAMKALAQSPISVSTYLQRPVILQVWRNLLPDELVRPRLGR